MAVKKEPNGRRSIQVEVEVPGTPEEVWRAIGTGAGISSWFVPSEMEERLGGELVCSSPPAWIRARRSRRGSLPIAWPQRAATMVPTLPPWPRSGTSKQTPAARALCASSTAFSPKRTTGTTS